MPATPCLKLCIQKSSALKMGLFEQFLSTAVRTGYVRGTRAPLLLGNTKAGLERSAGKLVIIKRKAVTEQRGLLGLAAKGSCHKCSLKLYDCDEMI